MQPRLAKAASGVLRRLSILHLEPKHTFPVFTENPARREIDKSASDLEGN